MARKPIAIAEATAQLARINEILSTPLMLIGGLAVHHYHIARESADIDLVCDHETQVLILRELYPSTDWASQDVNNDPYRPEIRITHKVNSNIPLIRFGPKITERGLYKHIVWDDLLMDSQPVRHMDGALERIRVPSVEKLCLMKALAFLGRNSAQTSKIVQDLRDVVDLSNHPAFGLNAFYNLLRAWSVESVISEGFANVSEEHAKILDGSSLRRIADLFVRRGGPMSPAISIGPASRKSVPIVELPSAPTGTIDRCASGTDECDWLKGSVVQLPAADDTSDLFLVWLDISPGYRAKEARDFLLQESGGLLHMRVESVYDVFGKHDMLLKLRGNAAERSIRETLQTEMGRRGLLGAKVDGGYRRAPVVLNVVRELLAFNPKDKRNIHRGITAFVYLSDLPVTEVDGAVAMLRRAVAVEDAAHLVGLFQTARDVVAELYLSCGGYYDLTDLVFRIESELNVTVFETKRTTLLVMARFEPDHVSTRPGAGEDTT